MLEWKLKFLKDKMQGVFKFFWAANKNEWNRVPSVDISEYLTWRYINNKNVNFSIQKRK